MTQAEDATLVREAKRGSEEAFAELVERHQGRVYSHALRLMGNPQDAEEVLQDTFVQAYRNLAKFEERSRFSTWIYRIATNEALMRLRKVSRKKEVFLEDTAGHDDESYHEELRDFARSALDEVLDAEIRDTLYRALADLPQEYRVVFTLRDIDGLSNAEVAESLGISVPAVKSRLHRSRLFLRDRLSHLYGERRKGSEVGKERK
jgi:RNA polymerase sigma-70 factor (ECF subfamily)